MAISERIRAHWFRKKFGEEETTFEAIVASRIDAYLGGAGRAERSAALRQNRRIKEDREEEFRREGDFRIIALQRLAFLEQAEAQIAGYVRALRFLEAESILRRLVNEKELCQTTQNQERARPLSVFVFFGQEEGRARGEPILVYEDHPSVRGGFMQVKGKGVLDYWPKEYSPEIPSHELASALKEIRGFCQRPRWVGPCYAYLSWGQTNIGSHYYLGIVLGKSSSQAGERMIAVVGDYHRSSGYPAEAEKKHPLPELEKYFYINQIILDEMQWADLMLSTPRLPWNHVKRRVQEAVFEGYEQIKTLPPNPRVSSLLYNVA